MFIKVYMKLAHTPSHTLAQSYSGYKTLVLESVVSQPFSNHGPFSDLISFLPGAHIHPILLSGCPPSVLCQALSPSLYPTTTYRQFSSSGPWNIPVGQYGTKEHCFTQVFSKHHSKVMNCEVTSHVVAVKHKLQLSFHFI